MPPPVPTWPREHHAECDGDAFLFYVAFGNIDHAQPMSQSKYRCEGVPDGFEVAAYNKKEHGKYIDGFLHGYVWDALVKEDFTLANSVMKSPGCTILHGSQTNPPSLNYLRDAIGLMTYFLDCGAIAIYDLQILHWYSPDTWRREIFEPAAPRPCKHAVILVSEEENPNLTWFHTRGMRKFGRPDLSVHKVAERHHDAVIEMFERFIDYQALGGIISDGQQIRMKALPPGGVARHGGSLEDPDFNNVHVEFVWPETSSLR